MLDHCSLFKMNCFGSYSIRDSETVKCFWFFPSLFLLFLLPLLLYRLLLHLFLLPLLLYRLLLHLFFSFWLPPLLLSAAVRMLSVVAGYGGGV